MNLDNKLIFFFSALGAFNSVVLSIYFLLFSKPINKSNYFLGGLLVVLSIRVWKSLFFYFNTLFLDVFNDFYNLKIDNILFSNDIRLNIDKIPHRNNLIIKKFDITKFGMSSYERKVSEIDFWIGKIIKKIDLKNTILIITSDHGDYIKSANIANKELDFKLGKTKIFLKRDSYNIIEFLNNELY